MSLTREEVDQFEREGWVMKRKVFSRGDLEPIRDALTEIVHREALALKEKGMLDEIYEDEPFETRLTRIRYASHDACQVIYKTIMGKAGGGFSGEAMFHFVRHRPLLSCIESLLGPDIIGSAIYRVRPKIPAWAHGEVPWHQDSGYFLPHCDKFLILTCWIPLVDATLENGCLHVLPGMHTRGVIRHFTGGHSGYLEVPGDLLGEVEPIPVEMEAGSVLFLTSVTPHASFENNSDTVRWSVDLRYQNMDPPNNVDEAPETYTRERDPVTMACLPTEADFVIRDTKNPHREVATPEEFHQLREKYEKTHPWYPGRGWSPMSERDQVTD